MAIKKTIEIDVNALQAVGGLKNLDDALRKVDQSTKSVEASFEEVYGDLKPLTARMGEAEDRLYELALAGQSASKEYKELLASVGNYRQVQIKTDLAVDAAATTLDSKLGGALQGVTSAFAGVQGVMALTGGQSEELEKAILKVQGAMALAEGVRGIREGATSFKALGTSAKAALNGIKTGIAATGIGLLVIALGAIVVYWDDIKEAVNGVSKEQEELNKKTQTNLEAETSKLDALSLQDNSLKLQGKSEKEILKLKLAQTNQIIKASEIQIEQSIATTKAQTEAAKRNQDILSGVLKFLSLPLTMILKTVDLVGKALGKDFGLEDKVFKGLSSFVFDPKETQAEGDKVVAEQKRALDKLKSDRDGLQLSIKNIDNQSAKEAADKRKEANAKAIELEKEKADALERIRKGEIDTQAERRNEELKQIQDEYASLILDAEKYGQDATALKEAQRTKEKELQAKFDAEDKDILDKKKQEEEKERLKAQEDLIKKLQLDKEFDTLSFDEKRAAIKAKEDILLQDKTLTEQQKTDLEKQYTDARIKISELEYQQKISQAKEAGQVLDNLGAIVGKQTAAGKALGIASALINTYVGASEALKQKSTLPSPFDYVAKAVNVAGILATGFKTVKAITAVNVPGGGGGGGGGGTPIAPPPAPSFNVVGNSGVNQIASTLGAQQPIQAFVVANQVTSQQAMDRNIVNNASLG